MKTMVLALGLVGVICVGSVRAEGVSYLGKLSGTGKNADGALFLTGTWDSIYADTTLSWAVDNVTTQGKWHYAYTLTVPAAEGLSADIQCVIVETSDGSPGPAFTTANLFSPTSDPAGWIHGTQVDLFAAFSEQNLPKDIYGVRFCTGATDPTSLVIAFDSDRGPTWGDFYARSFIVGSSYGTLYNMGLLAPEPDPSDPPRDGSVGSHVLVPNTFVGVPIPAPAAVFLGGVGVLLTRLLRQRHWL